MPAGQTGTFFWLMYGGTSPNNQPRAFINMGTQNVYSSPEAYPRSGSINLGPITSSNSFYIIVGWRDSNNNYNMTNWKNAANVSQDPNATGNSGGFTEGGTATGANGLPVDSDGNNVPEEAQNRWDKEVTLENDTDGIKTFRITTKDANGNIISTKTITVGPNSKIPWKMTSNESFSYEIDEASTVDGGETAWDNVESGNAVGTTPTQNNGTSTPTSTTSGASSTPTPTASTPQPNVPDEARPGSSPDPNAEARHKELRGELQRIASQDKAAMDKAHADAVADGHIQSQNKDALKSIADKLTGTQTSTGTTTGLGGDGITGTIPDEGAFSYSAGQTRATETKAGIDLIKTDLLALQNRLVGGVNANAALAWTIDFPRFGARVISLEGFSDRIAQIRTFILFFVAYKAIMDIISVLRGTFADEGKL